MRSSLVGSFRCQFRCKCRIFHPCSIGCGRPNSKVETGARERRLPSLRLIRSRLNSVELNSLQIMHCDHACAGEPVLFCVKNTTALKYCMYMSKFKRKQYRVPRQFFQAKFNVSGIKLSFSIVFLAFPVLVEQKPGVFQANF